MYRSLVCSYKIKRLTCVYEFLNALKEVRKGIVKGLLSATNWQVTYKSENDLKSFHFACDTWEISHNEGQLTAIVHHET